MELMNLLADAGMPIYSQLHSVSLNWIGKIILWLTTVCGSVGVGIILFSLLLKLVTMPFDVFQRINMRKQNIKMKENQERMEKLQKQYANDKEKYNQKVMEMYKESGISIASSCLPMILSLVIFIVAINAFNAFASYSNVENYNTMVRAYNESMLTDCAELDETTLTWTVTEKSETESTEGAESSDSAEEGGAIVESKVTGMTVTYKVESPDKYIYYTVAQEIAPTVDDATGAQTYIFDESLIFGEDGKISKDVYDYIANNNKKNYFVKSEQVYAENTAEIDTIAKALIEKATADGKTLTEADAKTQAIEQFFVSPAQDKVVEVYHSKVKKDTQFLWIKNVWAVDASYKHPVLSYGDFSQEIITRKSCSCKEGDKTILTIPAYTEYGYNNVTGKLGEQKSQPNGFFIMIVLSIGTILLQQWISMRSQKEQNKYSSVDGQSGSQQKMMMIIMTVMFAIFSFMYSSAFAIYLVVSNLFSLFSMLVINKLVDMAAERKAVKAAGLNRGDKVLSGRAAATQRNKTDGKNGGKKKNK